MAKENRNTRWRFVPLATALAVLAASAATFGAGIVLAPFAAFAAVVSARRLAAPRGSAYWLGAAFTTLLMFGFAAAVAIFVYDATIGSS